jgi:tRNA(Arg) A34 adenosine deaminase TadA
MIDITRTTDNYISEAGLEAAKSPCRTQHGCVAVVNGRIIARGHNHYRNPSSDGFVNDICTCHAEMAALRKIYSTINGRGHYNKNTKKNKIFKKVILYVVRINKENILKKSMPCTDCMEVIKALQIKRIIHSGDEGAIDMILPQDYKETYYTLSKKLLIKQIVLN